ncbi:putative protein 349L [Cricket iridovirus]|uniref:TFIIS-type domain-containing protein n=2 Tax=Iridoviridae TaxID=10486 RepID=A0A5B8RHB6_9VIRU|nr:putative protein 349L [Iridovirus Liz-CrIV]QNH08759.1 349L [Invertebrate iridescent virus Kaz2018]UIB20708.1 putative protein 349L [Cricket iridovirus]
MDLALKVKILKMLCKYLTNKNNISLFFNILTNIPNGDDYLFECVQHFIQMKNSNECDINDLFLKLKSQLLVWQDSSFEQFLKIEKEEDNFLESPLEVAEGAIKCKCGSERVFSFSKQTRSGDESTSVFALCSSCKSKWVL